MVKLQRIVINYIKVFLKFKLEFGKFKGGNDMFKKFFISIIMLTICLAVGVPAVTQAAQNINVIIDGKAVQFPDQKPYINADSRTMVPVRAPMEAMGCTVGWDEVKRQAIIEKDGVKAVFTIGSKDYTVNGLTRTMDTAPVIVNSRTAFPIRFVAEAFGAKVDWDPASYTVSIGADGNLEPIQQGGIVQATPEQVAEYQKPYNDYDFWTLARMIGGEGTKTFYEMTDEEKNIAWGLLNTGIIKQGQTFVTDKDLSNRSGKNLYFLEGYFTYSDGGKQVTVYGSVEGRYNDGSYSNVQIIGYDLANRSKVFEQYL